MTYLFDPEEIKLIKSENFSTIDSKVKENILRDIKYFKIRNSDIILLGYPKCGTTWAQEMVWLIANDLNFEKAKKCIDERFPNLEVLAFNIKQNPNITIPEFYSDSIRFVEKMDDPRFFKIHLKPSLLPEQLLNGEAKPKIIYVNRNVKDACLSSYHYLTEIVQLYNGHLDNYCKHFILRDDIIGNYWESVLYFWERRYEPNILFIKYEEMKTDLLQVIRRVSRFLNKNFTEDQESKLNKWLDFETVKHNPALNHDDIYKKSGFIRTGKIGEHKKEMSQAMIEKFDIWSSECVKGSDYEF